MRKFVGSVTSAVKAMAVFPPGQMLQTGLAVGELGRPCVDGRAVADGDFETLGRLDGRKVEDGTLDGESEGTSEGASDRTT